MENTSETPQKVEVTKNKSRLSRPIAVAMGIIALVFVAWVTVQSVKATPSVGEYLSANILPRLNAALVSITSVFIPAEKITVGLDPVVADSGASVTLTWEHNKNREGVYTFYYPCLENFSLQTEDKITVQCDRELDISGQQVINITPVLRTGGPIEVPIQISFNESDGGNAPVVGTASLSVNTSVAINPPAVSPSPVTSPTPVAVLPSPSASPSPSPKPTTPSPNPTQTFTSYETDTQTTPPAAGTTTTRTYTVTNNPTPVSANAQADLTVKIIAVGAIDMTTNAFTQKNPILATERAAIRFEIINIGTKKAEGWSFNAVLPTYPSHIFHSDSQQTLGPSDRIEYTLGFDKIDTSQASALITIYADPTNSVNESNKNNNLATTSISIIK